MAIELPSAQTLAPGLLLQMVSWALFSLQERLRTLCGPSHLSRPLTEASKSFHLMVPTPSRHFLPQRGSRSPLTPASAPLCTLTPIQSQQLALRGQGMIECDSFRPQGAADLSNNPPTQPRTYCPPQTLAATCSCLEQTFTECLLCLQGSRRGEEGRQLHTLLAPLRRLFCEPPPLPYSQTSSAATISSPRSKASVGGGRV